jgi:hypothetical protein
MIKTPAGVPELLRDVFLQVIAQLVGIPAGSGE